MLQEGDILKDRYKVQQLIGRGGMSRVFMGTDLKLTNKLWAIKEVSRKATDQAGRPIEQSLAIEAELLSKLDHPMIVDIADIVTTDECIYVVMDYVEGVSLDKVIREEGPQSEENVQDWVMQICDALDYLHNQDPPIIYRDMKPSNIMLRPDGYIKLIDLGVAREYKDQSTKDTVAFGTEGYAPPEQYGKAQTDARSDIYALGATMWHMLTGESPSEYPLPDVRSKNSKVGEGFAQVIVPKCTQLDRDLRYQNCNELIADLEVYEELTQEYFDKQKRKVMYFARSAIGGIAMLVLSLVLFLVGDFMLTQTYESQKNLGIQATDIEEKEEHFNEAISNKPGETEPYLLLLNAYMTSGKGTEDIPVLTKENFDTVHDLLEKNQRALKASQDYGKLYYEIGKAIWDNYDDGSSTNDILIRDYALNKAKDYFQIARDASTELNTINHCDMYIKVAEFNNQNKAFDDNDGVDSSNSQMMEDYVDSLDELVKLVKTSNSNKAKLNAYAIVQNALHNKAKLFPVANISKNRIENLEKQVREGLNDNNFTFGSAIYQNAKAKCIQSFNQAVSEVERQYSNSSIGGK